MADTISADPDRLFRFVAVAGDGTASLSPVVAALGHAFDEVARRCVDHRVPCPRLDRDLARLLHDSDQVGRRFLQAALRFLAADSGNVWPGSPRTSSGRSQAPRLATLLQLAGDPSSSGDDLHEIGHALLGLASSARSAVEPLGRILTAPVTLLTSPAARRVAEQLAHTPAASRVLARLLRYSSSSVAGSADQGLTTLSLVEDINRLMRDGNPLQAWHRKGAGYIADLAGTGFDLSGSACSSDPNFASCGAAALSGATWVGAETWQPRAGLRSAVDRTSQSVMNEMGRLRGLASDALDATGPAREGLIEAIRHADRSPGLVRIAPVVTHAVADTVQRVGAAAGAAEHKAEQLVSNGVRWLTG